ncbi:MAG: ABC transporter permease [Solirubrobacterales bacterium]|nr:ABC transporter permease [Solirubrobacterales bacterium]
MSSNFIKIDEKYSGQEAPGSPAAGPQATLAAGATAEPQVFPPPNGAARYDTPVESGSGQRGRKRPGRVPRWVKQVAVQLSAIAVLIGIWWAIAAAEVWPPLLLPGPQDVFQQLFVITGYHDGIRGYSNYFLQEHLWYSMSRLLQGVAYAIVLGVPVGILLAVVTPLKWIFGPAIDFLRNLPPLAYFSLLVIWFGIDDTPKVALLFLAAFPPVVIATADAVRSVPGERVNAVRMLGANRFQTILHVTVPSVMPEVMTGIRLATGIAFTTVVAAETINGIPGIGGMVSDAQRYNATDVVMLGIIVIGLCGLAIDTLIRLADRLLVPWRGH